MTSDAIAHDPATLAGVPAVVGGRWPWLRRRQAAARCVLALWAVLTALGVAIVLACFIDDRTIEQAPGGTVAEVIDTSLTRTVVRFTTADGRVYIPQNGVLYPAGLQRGQFVRVEYDRRNPDLVRVAGRSMTLSLLPVGSVLAVVWAILLPAYWVLRRAAVGRR